LIFLIFFFLHIKASGVIQGLHNQEILDQILFVFHASLHSMKIWCFLPLMKKNIFLSREATIWNSLQYWNK